MQGLGNDFMVVDGVRQTVALTPTQVRWLADRKYGVGFDQLLLIETAQSPEADFYYRIFNADGSEVAQCGNGARCVARFIQAQDLSKQDEYCLQTHQGLLMVKPMADEQVAVVMGRPEFSPQSLPCLLTSMMDTYQLTLSGQDLHFGLVSIGNPHLVMTVDNVDSAPVASLGAQLTAHTLFPQGVNVGFMQIMSPTQVKLRVYERGVGETLACGSGASAAVAVGIRQGVLANSVQVQQAGGNLTISWSNQAEPLQMQGPAQFVYSGKITLGAGDVPV